MKRDRLKEQEERASMGIWRAIDENREIDFLDIIHQRYFNKPLEDFYLNYTLDAFNEYKILNSTEEAKFKSIWVGITKMTIDYLVNIMKEEEEKRKGIDGKFE